MLSWRWMRIHLTSCYHVHPNEDLIKQHVFLTMNTFLSLFFWSKTCLTKNVRDQSTGMLTLASVLMTLKSIPTDMGVYKKVATALLQSPCVYGDCTFFMIYFEIKRFSKYKRKVTVFLFILKVMSNWWKFTDQYRNCLVCTYSQPVSLAKIFFWKSMPISLFKYLGDNNLLNSNNHVLVLVTLVCIDCYQ